MNGQEVSVLLIEDEMIEANGELAYRYFQLLELRQRVRIAECGTVIPVSDQSRRIT